MSRDISKRWCGAGSTPYILAHRLNLRLVFLLRHKIFAALAGDSREFIVAHPIRVNHGGGGLELSRHQRCNHAHESTDR